MGLLDTLLGRSKPVAPNLDALFGLPSAAITLELTVGLVATGRAGVCWKPPAGRLAEDVQRDVARLLEPDAGAEGAPGPAFTEADDTFGYHWLLVEDPELESLVARVHLINATLTDDGWASQLLCSVFGFTPGPDAAASLRPAFLVYLYKRGTFYPFVPLGGEKRDSAAELDLRAALGADLAVEPDVARWFPLWDLPVT